MPQVEKVSEIVREAICDWSVSKDDIQNLRAMWLNGKVSGAPIDVDFDLVLEEAHSELKFTSKHAS